MGITVISEGQAGEILVEDKRDGRAAVFLVCRPWNSPHGILVGPDTPSDLTGDFPVLESVRALSREEPREPFRITIDTTELPSGPLLFQSDTFISAAAEAARRGADRVVLNERTAVSWGLRLEPPQ